MRAVSHVGKGLRVKSRRWRPGIREPRWRGLGRPWRERDDRWGAREAGSSSEGRIRGIRPPAGPGSMGGASCKHRSPKTAGPCGPAVFVLRQRPPGPPNPARSLADRQTLRQTSQGAYPMGRGEVAGSPIIHSSVKDQAFVYARTLRLSGNRPRPFTNANEAVQLVLMQSCVQVLRREPSRESE